jgi:hypothetical protein
MERACVDPGFSTFIEYLSTQVSKVPWCRGGPARPGDSTPARLFCEDPETVNLELQPTTVLPGFVLPERTLTRFA